MWWHKVTHGRVKWRGNGRMEWVASTLHATSEHGVSSITIADAHTSAASSRLNWSPRLFKWTRPFPPERRNLVSARVPWHFNWPLLTELVFALVVYDYNRQSRDLKYQLPYRPSYQHWHIPLPWNRPEQPILGALAKLRWVIVNFVVTPSVGMELLVSHWTYFHDIWYLTVFFENIPRKFNID